jgi:Family of unknown function (DUF6188)
MIELKQLIGTTVQQLRFDYQVTLILFRPVGEAPVINATLVIEAPFQLSVGPEVTIVDPSNSESHSPVCRLLHSQVIDVYLSEGYDLTLDFDSGMKLSVSPIEDFDAWQLSGEGVPTLYVGPGQFSGQTSG